ncbi:MAG: 2-C-methyl-D-erythritol 2,4-cyclodiphosphate synthase [Bacteroidales bacterium]
MPALFRIGLGSDTHRLEYDNPLILGSIQIPHNKGCVAHSDGDVLIHSIIDAILGAMAKRDIGTYFPDNDEKWKDANSVDLLKIILSEMAKENYVIANLDCIIHAQKPKLSAYIPKMTSALSQLMNLSASQINIKAKTGEHIGFVGEEKGIRAEAIVLLYK